MNFTVPEAGNITADMFRSLYDARPFLTQNADTLNLHQLSDIFIEPTAHNSFACQNEIVKGRMGSGKTMYLRANYAHHRPSTLSQDVSILPIYLCLSQLTPAAGGDTGAKVYQEILIQMVDEMQKEFENLSSVYLYHGFTYDREAFANASAEVLAQIRGMRNYLNDTGSPDQEYRCVPNFQAVIDAFDRLSAPFRDPHLTLLILLDEVGSVYSSFFQSGNGDSSLFEILMNQLRTYAHCSYKIGIYPHHQEDILVGTRYGQMIDLDVDIIGTDYDAFISKCEQLIHRYVANALRKYCSLTTVHVEMGDIFELDSASSGSSDNMPYELAFAASGNFRRLVHVLDRAMSNAQIRHGGTGRINKHDITTAIKDHAKDLELSYDHDSRTALDNIVALCRQRKCFLFDLLKGAVLDRKLLFQNTEYQIITEYTPKTEVSGPVYRLDYAYCLYKDIPTNIYHLYGQDPHSTQIRTSKPQWITTVIHIPFEYLNRALEQRPLTKGTVDYIVFNEKKEGYIKTENGQAYHFREDDFVNIHTASKIDVGSLVTFLADKIGPDYIARSVNLINT